MPDFTQHKGSGHGHVYPNADGSKARCGGPALCSLCAKDLAALQQAEKFAQDTMANQYLNPEAVLAQMLDAMKVQMLIVMVNRLGGKVDIPVEEIDGTGQFMMQMSLEQTTGVFTFEVSKKS